MIINKVDMLINSINANIKNFEYFNSILNKIHKQKNLKTLPFEKWSNLLNEAK